MKRLKFWALCAVASITGPSFALITAPRPAEAQFTNMYTGGMWNNPASSLADTAILNNVFERMLVPDGATSGAVSPTQAYDLSASAFSPTAASLVLVWPGRAAGTGIGSQVAAYATPVGVVLLLLPEINVYYEHQAIWAYSTAAEELSGIDYVPAAFVSADTRDQWVLKV